jgi:ATP-dependent DNA helicase DinG
MDMLAPSAPPCFRPGDRVTVEIDAEMRDRKGYAARFLVGRFIAYSPSGKAARILARPGRATGRPAPLCLRCNRPLEREDSRLVGYGPDCARELGIAWPHKNQLDAAEIARVQAALDALPERAEWLPLCRAVDIQPAAPAPRQPVALDELCLDGELPPAPPPAPRDDTMVAKVGGTCATCGQRFPVGARVRWDGATRHHVTCPIDPGRGPQAPPPRPESARSPAARNVLAVLGPGGTLQQANPAHEVRWGQLELSCAAADALAAGRHLVGHAPTGTGKGLAYTLPLVQAVKRTGRRAIVSTADKGLQAQLAEKDFPALQAHVPFSFAVLKGRGNYVCKQALAELGEAMADDTFGWRDPRSVAAAPGYLAWARATARGDVETYPGELTGELRAATTVSGPACGGQQCPFYDSCHANNAIRDAADADLALVNHSLLAMDLRIRKATDDYGSVIPFGRKPRPIGDAPTIDEVSDATADLPFVAIDEAHRLEDVVCDAYAREVTLARAEALATRAVHFVGRQRALDEARAIVAAAETPQEQLEGLPAIPPERLAAARQQLALARDIQETAARVRTLLEQALREIAAKCADIDGALRLGDARVPFGGVLSALDHLGWLTQESTPAWLDGKLLEAWDRWGRQAQALAEDLQACVTPTEGGAARYAEPAADGLCKLTAQPFEAAAILRAQLWERFPSVVAVSATITTGGTFTWWRARVGLDACEELIVPSPFDYQAQALLYLPAGEGFDPQAEDGSEDYWQRMAAECRALITASRGGAFILCTSNKALRQLRNRLAALPYQLLVQGEGLSRGEMVARFRQDGNAVLIGVKSFWEGVDVAGEALRLVIVDKQPFVPHVDPVQAAREAAITARGGSGFRDLSLPQSIIATQQGTGRLIRTQRDRGVLALLDGRLTRRRWGQDVLDSLPAMPRTRAVADITRFFTA